MGNTSRSLDTLQQQAEKTAYTETNTHLKIAPQMTKLVAYEAVIRNVKVIAHTKMKVSVIICSHM